MSKKTEGSQYVARSLKFLILTSSTQWAIKQYKRVSRISPLLNLSIHQTPSTVWSKVFCQLNSGKTERQGDINHTSVIKRDSHCLPSCQLSWHGASSCPCQYPHSDLSFHSGRFLCIWSVKTNEQTNKQKHWENVMYSTFLLKSFSFSEIPYFTAGRQIVTALVYWCCSNLGAH